MRRRFFVDHFDDSRATLHGESAEHLGRVLRAEPGQLYELSDGHRVWLARVERVTLSKREDHRVDFSLIEQLSGREPPLHTELLLAVVKFDRFEWAIEKATELGVATIVPLEAERSDKALLAAAAKRSARWERILLESAQQSRRLRPPTLGHPAKPAAAFAQAAAAHKLLLSERPAAQPLGGVLPAGVSLESAAIAIGPEGGWTDDEFAAASAAGFREVSLGENILRTETAVTAALAVLRFAFAGNHAP